MSEEAMGYRLVNGGNPCDICDGLEGVYPSPPAVPFHVRCACTVQVVELGTPFYEVRDIEVHEADYTEESEEGEFTNSENVDYAVEITIELGVIEEELDAHVAAEVDWTPDYGEPTWILQVPPRTHVSFTAEIAYRAMMCGGELWKIYPVDDGSGGIHTREYHVGRVGGTALARIGLVAVTVHASSLDDAPSSPTGPADDGDDYFIGPDELPT